ncbi:bet1-like SNARE 1-1 isoform X1 [Iris pallida]|uniref:Bet1-like SNARE 1-1 isoform X1 n=1 Tax=Iris pallida TaxID=29817 RepID=A0AAX6GF21_IRIPA|nr:bet1-like SNARE 1-1 isoform X1 [Iris pallida]
MLLIRVPICSLEADWHAVSSLLCISEAPTFSLGMMRHECALLLGTEDFHQAQPCLLWCKYVSFTYFEVWLSVGTIAAPGLLYLMALRRVEFEPHPTRRMKLTSTKTIKLLMDCKIESVFLKD